MGCVASLNPAYTTLLGLLLTHCCVGLAGMTMLPKFEDGMSGAAQLEAMPGGGGMGPAPGLQPARLVHTPRGGGGGGGGASESV